MNRLTPGSLLICAALVAGCSGNNFDFSSRSGKPAQSPATTQADSPQGPGSAEAFEIVSGVLQNRGQVHDGVLTFNYPRDDLFVSIEGMDIPTAAGLQSTVHFFLCPCGKTILVGQFLVTDYEANDVAYALQKENILVSSMSPALIYEKPRLTIIRFQAEGYPRELASAVKSALDWMGKNRLAPQSRPSW